MPKKQIDYTRINYLSFGLGGARDLRNANEKQRDHAQIEHDLWHVNVDEDCEFCQLAQEQQNNDR